MSHAVPSSSVQPRPSAPAGSRGSTPRTPRAIADSLHYDGDFIWAFDSYKDIVLAVAREYGLKRHFEIGGGRDPLFSPDDLARHDFSVAINDISEHELALAPDGFEKVLCDISAPNAATAIGAGRYDFAYCRMVMEHVRDVPQMWRNVAALLQPGGVALSFFPTLFAPPFVVNRLMPERLTHSALVTLFPERAAHGGDPKFPAFYDHCRSSEQVIAPMLAEAGFSDVTILPFYGYAYFWKIPGLKQIDAAFTRLAREKDWRTFSSFAYVIARK